MLKSGILTSEWWAFIVYVILEVLKASVIPDLSENVFIVCLTYMGLRGALKGTQIYTESKAAPCEPKGDKI